MNTIKSNKIILDVAEYLAVQRRKFGFYSAYFKITVIFLEAIYKEWSLNQNLQATRRKDIFKKVASTTGNYTTFVLFFFFFPLSFCASR